MARAPSPNPTGSLRLQLLAAAAAAELVHAGLQIERLRAWGGAWGLSHGVSAIRLPPFWCASSGWLIHRQSCLQLPLMLLA